MKIDEIVAKICQRILEDEEFTSMIREDIETNVVDCTSVVVANPEVQEALKKIMVEAIENVEVDDDLITEMWGSEGIKEATKLLLNTDENVRSKVIDKLREFITDRLKEADADDLDLSDDIDSAVKDAGLEQIKLLIANDADVKKALDKKFRELINDHLDSLSIDDLSERQKEAIISSLFDAEKTPEFLLNRDFQKVFQLKLGQAIISWMEGGGADDEFQRWLRGNKALQERLDGVIKTLFNDIDFKKKIESNIKKLLKSNRSLKKIASDAIGRMFLQKAIDEQK